MSRPLLAKLPTAIQWLAVIALAGVAGWFLKHLNVPAAYFLGPMLATICFGVAGATIRLPVQAFRFGQGCVGLLVAHAMTPAVLHALAEHWHLMLFVTLLTLLLSVVVGVGLVRFGGFASSTAAWGTAPGAASAMVAMSEDYGADGRVVAALQYVRVVCVVVAGALVSRLLGVDGGGSDAHSAAMPLQSDQLLNIVLSLAIVLVSLLGASRIPAGALLLPLIIGGALQLGGLLQISVPTPLLALAYGLLGGYVGLRFDRTTVLYVWRRLPVMAVGSLVLIALSAACAWLLARMTGLDFLSLYLATSPGGLDSMAIIAMDTHSDVGLVLAMQTLRLFGVILCGAYLARLVMRLTD